MWPTHFHLQMIPLNLQLQKTSFNSFFASFHLSLSCSLSLSLDSQEPFKLQFSSPINFFQVLTLSSWTCWSPSMLQPALVSWKFVDLLNLCLRNSSISLNLCLKNSSISQNVYIRNLSISLNFVFGIERLHWMYDLGIAQCHWICALGIERLHWMYDLGIAQCHWICVLGIERLHWMWLRHCTMSLNLCLRHWTISLNFPNCHTFEFAKPLHPILGNIT